MSIELWIIIGVVVVIIVMAIISDNYKKFVKRNSIAIQQLKEFNAKYDFHIKVSYDMENSYDNEFNYGTVSCQDYLTYELQFYQEKIIKEINEIDTNCKKYQSYMSDVSSIKLFGNFTTCKGHALWLLKLFEKDIFNKTILHPCTSFCLEVTLYRTNINGNIYESKSEKFYKEDIFAITKRLNNKNGYFFNDREIWNALCRVERAKVSNKMRFSIYKRDGYKCRICGARDSEAYLEIDHIKPIAKGGKSTYDNLQTLCHRCNVKKGDKDYYR